MSFDESPSSSQNGFARSGSLSGPSQNPFWKDPTKSAIEVSGEVLPEDPDGDCLYYFYVATKEGFSLLFYQAYLSETLMRHFTPGCDPIGAFAEPVVMSARWKFVPPSVRQLILAKMYRADDMPPILALQGRWLEDGLPIEGLSDDGKTTMLKSVINSNKTECYGSFELRMIANTWKNGRNPDLPGVGFSYFQDEPTLWVHEPNVHALNSALKDIQKESEKFDAEIDIQKKLIGDCKKFLESGMEAVEFVSKLPKLTVTPHSQMLIQSVKKSETPKKDEVTTIKTHAEEYVESLGKKKCDLEKKFQQLQAYQVQAKIDEVLNKLGEAKDKLAGIQKGGELQEGMTKVRERLAEIQKNLAEIQKTLVKIEKLVEIEKVAEIQEKVADVQKLIESQKTLTEIEDNVTEVEKLAETAAGSVGPLTGEMSCPAPCSSSTLQVRCTVPISREEFNYLLRENLIRTIQLFQDHSELLPAFHEVKLVCGLMGRGKKLLAKKAHWSSRQLESPTKIVLDQFMTELQDELGDLTTPIWRQLEYLCEKFALFQGNFQFMRQAPFLQEDIKWYEDVVTGLHGLLRLSGRMTIEFKAEREKLNKQRECLKNVPADQQVYLIKRLTSTGLFLYDISTEETADSAMFAPQ